MTDLAHPTPGALLKPLARNIVRYTAGALLALAASKMLLTEEQVAAILASAEYQAAIATAGVALAGAVEALWLWVRAKGGPT